MNTNNDNQFSDDDLKKILRQAQQVAFERLQHKTAISTVFLEELLDSPESWLLGNTFFEVDIKDKNRKNLIHALIKDLQNIALSDTKELLLEQDYEVDFTEEEPIMYRGFFMHIRMLHKELYLKSVKLNCLDFRGLCECIRLKAYAQLYFEHLDYEASFYCSKLAGYVFGSATNKISGENDFQTKLSEVNREKSLSYWTPKKKEKEERKAKYLKIMNEQGFSKYTDAAEYIYSNENTENRKYRQIYDELREADNE